VTNPDIDFFDRREDVEVLVIVDVQKDFCPGGSLAVERGDIVADAIKNHLERLDAIGEGYDYVVTTQDWHIEPEGHFSDTPDYVDTWPVHCLADTDGADFHDSIKDVLPFVDEHFYKGEYEAAYSGFEGRNAQGVLLGDWLRSLDGNVNVTVVGIAYDYCVKATAIDAAHQGFNPQIIFTLTAPVHPDGRVQQGRQMIQEGVIIHAIES
jgi:nicotinamidase/pyrazinamidase